MDVRTPGEFGCVKNGHVKGAINHELYYLPDSIKDLSADREYVAYCSGGYRSAIAMSFMRARGLKTLDIIGGYRAIQEKAPELTTAQGQ